MKDIVDIDVIIDEKYLDPLVNIYTFEQNRRIDNIIYAIENAAQSDIPPIGVFKDNNLMFVSQRDIFRLQIIDRRTLVETDEGIFESKMSLTSLEELLDEARFIRISQSEIINLYHVKSFDFTLNGTITVRFDNGEESWVARRRVKALKDMLQKSVK